MQSFRFIHTGDIHLDSPLKGLAGQQGAAAERLRTATRTAFESLISQAIEDEVDFVVIAGDLYDGDWRDYQTGLFFVKQMGRLAQAKIPVFLLHGSRDAESQITRKLTLPTNVSVFPARKAETFRLPHLNVALHGQSFRQRDITRQSGPGLSVTRCGLLQHRRLAHRPGRNAGTCELCAVRHRRYDQQGL